MQKKCVEKFDTKESHNLSKNRDLRQEEIRITYIIVKYTKNVFSDGLIYEYEMSTEMFGSVSDKYTRQTNYC